MSAMFCSLTLSHAFDLEDHYILGGIQDEIR